MIEKPINKKESIKQFNQLVVIDPIILSLQQWEKLSSFAKKICYFLDLNRNNQRNIKKISMIENLTIVDKSNLEMKNSLLKESDAIITCWTPISDDILLSNLYLSYIGFWTHHVEGKVNIELARKKGITVTYIPDYAIDAVAEMVFAGILSISRKILREAKDTLKGKWSYEYLKTGTYVPSIEEISPRLLAGKILGIVGLGRIGQRVAEIALAFKMDVQYYSRTRHLDFEANGVNYVELDTLFSTSDIISIHLSPNAPLNMINKDLIKKMKDGSIFVNTATGRVVDQEALFEEIRSGRIYAYLDVYNGLPPRKILNEVNALDNLFTYRRAWFTKESVTLKGELLIKNIERYLIEQKEAKYAE